MSKVNNNLKLSMFVHIVDNKIVNDFNSAVHPIDESIISILKNIESRTLPQADLLNGRYRETTNKTIEVLFKKKILIPSHIDERGYFYPKMVDIETVRHCNARCVYCPQSVDFKPNRTMSLSVFKQILNRLKEYTPSWVTFNHYGEPLLDPLFKERANLLSKAGMKLFLATNGTLLTNQLVDYLGKINIHSLHFNFPSINNSQWSDMMGLPKTHFNMAKNAIINTIQRYSYKIDINIVVNSIIENRSSRAFEIREYFENYGKFNLILADTRSRCGTICNKHVAVCNHSGQYFGGCERVTNHLYISHEGKCFLCSDDYYQKVELGDLLEEDIHCIMNSERNKQIKSEIYGLSPMREDLICRKCVKLRKRKNL